MVGKRQQANGRANTVVGPFGRLRSCLLAMIGALLLTGAYPVSASDIASVEAGSQQRPLTMGILPFMSPIALLKRFAPLRDYLSRQLDRPVLLETAYDFPAFFRRTLQQRYDIVYTAPHFVPPALASGAYTLQATYARPLSAVLLVRTDGPIAEVADLAGRVIATPPPEALVTIVGRAMLDKSGLTGKRAPLYRNYRSHNAAYQAVEGGEAAAAVVTVNIVSAPELERADLRILARSADLPAVGLLTAANLPKSLQHRIGTALVALRDSDAGRSVLRSIRIPPSGYRWANSAEFGPLTKYLPECVQHQSASSPGCPY